MKIIPFYSGGMESNSFLVTDSGEAVLIDAGASPEQVSEALQKENAVLKYILLTHGHFDHTVYADSLRDTTGAKLLIHGDDAEMLTDAHKSALAVFFNRYDTVRPCDGTVKNSDTVTVGSTELKVIHTPGHSNGSVCYLTEGAIFAGDTLFAQGFGRFDLYGGSFEKLKNSLSALKSLNGELDIYSGHGGPSKLKKALDRLNFI